MPAPIKWLNDKTVFTAFGSIITDATISIRPDFEPIVGYTYASGTDTGVAISRDNDSFRNTSTGAGTTSLAGSATIDEQHLSLDSFAGGLSVAVWTEVNDATGDRDVFARTFFGFSNSLSAPFLVNVGDTVGDQFRPEVTTLGSDRFVLTWADTTTGQLKFAIYDLNGDTIKAPSVLSQSQVIYDYDADPLTRVSHLRTSLIELDNGNFVAGYSAGSDEGLFRVFDRNGNALTNDIDVDGGPLSSTLVGLEALSDGRFFALQTRGLGTGNLLGRFFNADGTPSTDFFDVPGLETNSPRGVTELKDGRLLVTGSTFTGDFIFGQIIRPDGTADGGVFTINSTAIVPVPGQMLPDMETLPDGRVMVVWTTMVNGVSKIMETIFDPRETGLFTSASSFKDFWHGTDFSDVALMGDGDDSFFGYLGNDVVYGEAGDDILRGGDGNDTFIGGLGNDTLEGDIGNDNLNGNLGNDTLRGGDGNDILLGEGGNDTLEGGNNDDSLNGGTGNDTLKGGSGVDLLQGEAGNDNLQAGTGNDTLFGQAGTDTMFGETGNDTMFGGDGNDTLFGQDDDDTMFGENNNDTLLGGAGNDFLFGQAGDDTLLGEAGGDFLSGEGGFDQLTGGSGADTYFWNSFTQGADIVSDFSHTEGDKVMLDRTAFGVAAGLTLVNGSSFVTGSGAVALQATASIIFDTATNLLWFDPDGTGAAGKQALAFLTNGGGGITAGDIIFS